MMHLTIECWIKVDDAELEPGMFLAAVPRIGEIVRWETMDGRPFEIRVIQVIHNAQPRSETTLLPSIEIHGTTKGIS